jgi:hypothetical protein
MFKAIKLEILDEDCDKLIAAITDGMSVSKALATVADPSIAHDNKWAARKMLLMDELPGYNLADRAYVRLVLQPKLTRKLDLRAYIINPELAHAEEGIKLERQAQQPHALYHRTPKDPALAELLRPIWHLIKEVTKDRNGVTRHSIPTTVNKLLRLLAYEIDDKQSGDGSRSYRVTNGSDPVHDEYIAARQRKLAQLKEQHRNLLARRPKTGSTELIDPSIEFGSFEVDESEVGVDPPPVRSDDSVVIPITAMSQPTAETQASGQPDSNYVERWLAWEAAEVERINAMPQYCIDDTTAKLLAQEKLTKERAIFQSYCQQHGINWLVG